MIHLAEADLAANDGLPRRMPRRPCCYRDTGLGGSLYWRRAELP